MTSHRIAFKSRQRGMSFFGLVFVGFVLVAAFAIGGQSFPIWLEYSAISKAIEKAKVETSVMGVRAAFDRAAAVDDITTISGKDLQVTATADKTVVTFAYEREIHLAGPAYLVYRFDGRAETKPSK